MHAHPDGLAIKSRVKVGLMLKRWERRVHNRAGGRFPYHEDEKLKPFDFLISQSLGKAKPDFVIILRYRTVG